MGLIIEDGKGTGNTTQVKKDNRLAVHSVSASIEHYVNHDKEQAYTAGFAKTPTGAGDCFGYIINNNDIDLIVSTLMVNTASDETIIIKFGDIGTPVGGSDITIVNRNAGSGNTADVTAQSGVDITGLSGGNPVASVFVKGGESSEQIEILSSLIVPKNKMISFYVNSGAIAVTLGLSVYFHEAD